MGQGPLWREGSRNSRGSTSRKSCGMPASLPRAIFPNLLINNVLQTGDLGFEPSSPASTSHRKDIGLTLENSQLQVFTIHAAPIYIVVTLG